MVVGAGFEPANSKRADLQSAAFNHFAIPPLLRSKKIPEKRRLSILIFTKLYIYELQRGGIFTFNMFFC